MRKKNVGICENQSVIWPAVLPKVNLLLLVWREQIENKWRINISKVLWSEYEILYEYA